MADFKMNRRTALKSIAASTFASVQIVPRHVLGGEGYTPPSEMITRGVIGIGSQGSRHLGKNSSGGKKQAVLVAVSDVDTIRMNKLGKEVRKYQDWRELIDQKDIDVINIPTPPHWHGLMAIAAANAGKDIWCEKPMTRTIGEGIKLVEACKNNGTILRVNTFVRMGESNFYGTGSTAKECRKLIKSGMLGWPLKVVVSGETGFIWKHGWSGKFNLKPEKVPDTLDYDMWLGPAPWKPYNAHRTGVYNPKGTFRGYWDYDGGGLGDMAMHYLDPIQYILGKDHTSPVRVEVDTDDQHPDVVRPWRRVTLKYADGCEIILDGNKSIKGAALFEGPKGKVYKGFKSNIPNLRKKVSELPDPAPLEGDFFKCVRERIPFGLDEVKAHRSTTMVNISKIALRLNRSLDFDPVKQRFINDEEANSYIYQPMRSPWTLPGEQV